MADARTKNLRVLLLAGTLMALMSGLVAYAPTLYRMFCSLTGYGGTVQRAVAPLAATTADGPTVRVSFDANVAPGLDWSFGPEQRQIETRLGEPTKVYFRARNNSERTVVARAVFNVTPYKVAPYFFKIECFCFTEEKLGPGESARMPLVFYVDEQLAKDPTAEEVHDITLSYTFYAQTGLTAEAVAAARDLKAGSAATDARLNGQGRAAFDNDAPRD